MVPWARGAEKWDNDPPQVDSKEVVVVDDIALPEDIRLLLVEKQLLKAAKFNITDCDKAVQDLRRIWMERSMGSRLEKIVPALRMIESFTRGTTSIVQGIGDTGMLVWGSFQLLLSVNIIKPLAKTSWLGEIINCLQVVVRYKEAIDNILACVDTLSKALPIAKAYTDLYPTEQVKKALRRICVLCLEFCGQMLKYLKRSKFKNFIRIACTPVEDIFGGLHQKIQEARADFEREVSYDHTKFVKTALETLLTPSPDVKKTQVACHIIPFAENKRFFPRPQLSSKIENQLLQFNNEQGFRAVLLHGLGGSGKTQLALKFVYAHYHKYDVIIWVAADTVDKLAEDFLQAAETLRIDRGDDSKSVQASMRTWLQECHSKWLIVFDNVDDASLLQDYWPNSARGSGSVLITSRTRNFEANMLNDVCEVPSLDDEEGASMILRSLRLDSSDPKLKSAAVDMSWELGGLPLAIAQMTGYMQQTGDTSLEHFLKLYRTQGNASRLHCIAANGDLQYEHTLETVFRVSFLEISSDILSQTILSIAVFLDPDEIPEALFRLDAVTSLPQGPRELHRLQDDLLYDQAASKLVSHFLVGRNTKDSTLSIHRLVQKSALELFKQDETHLQRAYHWAVRLVYEAFPRQSPLGKPIPNWPACQLYTKHVLHLLKTYDEAGLRNTCGNECKRLLTELFCDCGVYLWARGLYADAERLAKVSIEIAEAILSPNDCLCAQPYTLLGCVYLRSENRLKQAHEALQRALEIRQTNLEEEYRGKDAPMDVQIQLSNAYSNLGIAAKQMRQYDKAAELHYSSIDVKRRYPEFSAGFLLALSFHNLGKVRRLQGDIEEAAGLFRQAVQEMQHEKSDSQDRKGVFLCSLGDIEERLGNVDSARAYLVESLDVLRGSGGESSDMGITCHRLGVLKFRLKDFEEALLLFKTAVQIFSRGHLLSPAKLMCSTYWLGLAHGALEQSSEAAQLEQKAAELYFEMTGKQPRLGREDTMADYEELLLDD